MAGLFDSFDIVVKDEGSFKSVFFQSKKAKDWAKKNDLRNDSAVPKKNWKVDLKNSHSKQLVKVLEKDGLTVMEF